MEKEYVRSMFDRIAYRYDLLNHLLSGGIDLLWRRAAIDALAETKPKRILDVATGTADLAIASLRLHPESVVGVDISEEMLAIGKRKVEEKGLSNVITLETGEAEHLRFGDGTFDAAMVAFGARNFEHLTAGLTEMHRVLRPGGTVVVLEFSKPTAFPFRQLYFFYFRSVLPAIGRLVSKHREAYQYLPDTVMKFPDGEAFLNVLDSCGFTRLSRKPMTFGIATIYSGSKR
ncbi:MAG: bifunctional demethylmenaquinone methyltransferase/2-methoxy-6-polyprenyl-1,4-benzoquinol methylase UbiE [Acidobacteriota bacterium]